MCSRYLPDFIAQPSLRLPAPPRIALSRKGPSRMIEDGSATTPPEKTVETEASGCTPTEASSAFGRLEKDMVDGRLSPSERPFARSWFEWDGGGGQGAGREGQGRGGGGEGQSPTGDPESGEPERQDGPGEGRIPRFCPRSAAACRGILRHLRTGAAAGGARRRGLGITGLSGSRARAGSGSG